MEGSIVQIDSGSMESGDWRSYRGIAVEGALRTFLLWSLQELF